jgi:hypothetical protein
MTIDAPLEPEIHHVAAAAAPLFIENRNFNSRAEIPGSRSRLPDGTLHVSISMIV